MTPPPRASRRRPCPWRHRRGRRGSRRGSSPSDWNAARRRRGSSCTCRRRRPRPRCRSARRPEAEASQDDHRADDFPCLHVLERRLDAVQLDPLGDHSGEIEPALGRQGHEQREILRGNVIAAVRDEDPLPPVERAVERHDRLGPGLREPDVDQRPRMPEHPQPERHGLWPTDDVEDEVETLRLARMGRPEAATGVELALVQVESMDLRRTGNPCSLDHGQANRAAADDADACALPDLGRLQDRADARRDRASDQACLLRRKPVGKRHERGRVDHGPRGKGPRPHRAHQVPPVPRVHPPSRHSGRSAEMARPAETPGALPARRAPADDDTVPGADVFDSLTDRLDHTCAFVPEQDRHRMVEAGSHDVEVGVADAAGLDPDPRLPSARRVELDLLDAEALELVQDDAAIHDRSRLRASRPPTSASVRSVSAIRCRITASTPSWPPTARPYAYGRPSRTASAPSASALSTSEPRLIPPSISTTGSGPTAWRTSSSASSAATAPSTWRPPWFETTMPSTPDSRAR